MQARVALILCMLLALVLAAGCTPSSNPVAGPDDDAAGFWKGIWHGFILLFTLVISLFNENVGVYEIQNTGRLYDLGFLLGVMMFFGGSCGGAGRKSK